MIGLEQIRNRLKVLEDRAAPLRREYDALLAGPETPEGNARLNELAQGLQVMVGRRLECESWIEMLEAYPGVSRPDQMPTKGNTPAYVPITQRASPRQVERSREATAKRDAAELTDLLPNLE